MKKNLYVILLTLIACLPAFGQMEITVRMPDKEFDTVRIYGYQDGKQVQKYATAYQPIMVFKDKQPLEDGVYWIMQDSVTLLDAFIISSPKTQKFSVTITDTGATYTNSKENTMYHDYMRELQLFDNQAAALDAEFQQAQQGGIPSYMMQVFVDSLMAKYVRVSIAKEQYQVKAAEEAKGLLLSSVIKANTTAPNPSKETVTSEQMYQAYIVEHFFDHFPWNDPRIFNTMLAENKIKQYCNIIYQLDRPSLDTFVIATLKESMVNVNSFNTFFDKLEKVIGSYMSPYKVEHTYIKMLQEALAYPKLETARKVRYEKELARINKNLAGSTVPNFNMVMSNGDTTTLYDVEAEYMLLYLQHPTCPTCREVRGKMVDFTELNKAIASGKLKVLTVYFEGDNNVWNNFINSSEANPNYLHGWNYDLKIEEDDLFDTRTIPYMFLLDKDKKVIRKDLLWNEIEDYVRNLR
ncbi:MAG: DUF5106 domain-containing protein [Bacteroidales bacterium]|nr:DUF5106 domain-containing protein [Bacteroidales bacterium]